MASTSAGSGPRSTEDVSDAIRKAAVDLGSALGFEFSDFPVGTPGPHPPQRVRHQQRTARVPRRLGVELAVADLLYNRYPAATEGDLTLARAALVRREALAAAARDAGVGEHLVLGAGARRSGDRNRDSILANAFEALLGAIYLEGGYAAVRGVVERTFAGRLEEVTRDATAKDPKTRLQELLQARGLGLPRYRIVASEGSAHRPTFLVECDAGIASPVQGEGASRRQAEQRAADRVLAEIGDER